MIELRTNIDVEKVMAALDDRLKRQVPYALALALNRTAQEVAAAARDNVRRGFRLRAPGALRFIRAAIPDPRGPYLATKQRPRVIMSVESAVENLGKSARYAILPMAEAGGVRVATRGLAGGKLPPGLPVPVRSHPNEVIPRKLYPGALGLQEVRAVHGGLEYKRGGASSRRRNRKEARGLAMRSAFKGRHRTFIARSKAGTPLIVQRLGKGKRNTRLLFTMRARTKVPARHFFFPTAREIIGTRMPINFEGYLALAIRTAR